MTAFKRASQAGKTEPGEGDGNIMTEKLYAKRGRTGREGVALKTYGGSAAIIGLLWSIIVFTLESSFSAYVIPVLILISGFLAFWIGRGIAIASARGT